MANTDMVNLEPPISTLSDDAIEYNEVIGCDCQFQQLEPAYVQGCMQCLYM